MRKLWIAKSIPGIFVLIWKCHLLIPNSVVTYFSNSIKLCACHQFKTANIYVQKGSLYIYIDQLSLHLSDCTFPLMVDPDPNVFYL